MPFHCANFQETRICYTTFVKHSCEFHENQTNVKILTTPTNAQFNTLLFYYLAPTCNGTVPIHAKQNTPYWGWDTICIKKEQMFQNNK